MLPIVFADRPVPLRMTLSNVSCDIEQKQRNVARLNCQ
jgi:hypothetical protein